MGAGNARRAGTRASAGQDAGAAAFEGLGRGAFTFLRDLSRSENNHKAWFDANRGRYEEQIVKPLKALVATLAPALLDLDPRFEVNPATNKTLTRINRDMRFARNLPPYKDHMLALFYRVGRKKEDGQLFVGVQPGGVWSGLYVGGHLLGPDSPVRRDVRGLAQLGRRCGVGRRFRLGVCEHYGEVARELPGQVDEDYLTGPHLVVLREQSPDEAVGLGAGLADDVRATLRALHPLWARYSHA